MLLLVSIKNHIVRIYLITWLCIHTRIQGHCNDEKKCPLLHPEREDDGYVPPSQNTSSSNERYNSRIVSVIEWLTFGKASTYMLSSAIMEEIWITKRQGSVGSFGIMKAAEMILAISLMKT